jgi:hypothetical protein
MKAGVTRRNRPGGADKLARHAAARRVEVKLESAAVRSASPFTTTAAASPPLPPPKPGRLRGPGPRCMIGMRARARSAGGDVTARSRPGEGVLIEVRVPISGPAVGHTE